MSKSTIEKIIDHKRATTPKRYSSPGEELTELEREIAKAVNKLPNDYKKSYNPNKRK